MISNYGYGLGWNHGYQPYFVKPMCAWGVCSVKYVYFIKCDYVVNKYSIKEFCIKLLKTALMKHMITNGFSQDHLVFRFSQ